MTDLTTLIALVGAAVAALFGLRFKWKSDGRKSALRDAEDADHEAAADLRDTVDRNLVNRVRDMEGRGYRD